MSMVSMISVLLSLVMAISSVNAPGQYGEATISDLVIRYCESYEDSDYREEFSLDLTGLSLGMGMGADEEGKNGVITLDLGCNSNEQQAMLQMQNGEVLLSMDGLPFALTLPMPSEEELDQMMLEYAGTTLEDILVFEPEAVDTPTTAETIAALAEYLNAIPCQSRKIVQSRESFMDGQLTADVTRVEFAMTAEEAQSFVLDIAETARLMLEESNLGGTVDVDEVENLGAITGVMCYADNLFSLSGTTEILSDMEPMLVQFDIFFHTDGDNVDFHAKAEAEESQLALMGTIRANADGRKTTDMVLSMTEAGETADVLALNATTLCTETRKDMDAALHLLGEEILMLDLTYENTADRLYMAGQAELNFDYTSLWLQGSYDAAITEAEGVKTLDGALDLSVKMNDYGDVMEVALSCGLDFHQAPVGGYTAQLPESIRRVKLEEMTEREMGQLQGAAVAFVAPALTIPGISDLMVQEGIFYEFDEEAREEMGFVSADTQLTEITIEEEIVADEETAAEEEDSGSPLLEAIRKGIED